MSLVETLHRAHLQRQIRIMQAALSYQARTPTRQPVVTLPVALPEPEKKEAEIPAGLACEPVVLGGYSPNTLRIETVRKFVAQHYGVRQHDLMSDRRTANLVIPRHVVFYLCRRLTYASLPMIGRHMGGRDHTTVLSGVRKVARVLKTDERLRASIEMLTEQLGGEPE